MHQSTNNTNEKFISSMTVKTQCRKTIKRHW